MQVSLARAADLTPADPDELRALATAVYPPDLFEPTDDGPVTWAPAQWSIRVRDDAGALVSHVGVLARDARVDGLPAQIGGVGGVKTHPAARGQGYAAAGLHEALRFFTDDLGVAFALLVCLPPTVPYYEGRGWRRFDGTLLVEQPGGTVRFTANLPMVRPIRGAAPEGGTIDLCGYPW